MCGLTTSKNSICYCLHTVDIKGRETQKLFLNLEKSLAVDDLVDLGAYISALAGTKIFKVKQESPTIIFAINHPASFRIKLANGRFKKPIARTTLQFVIGDHTFAGKSNIGMHITNSLIRMVSKRSICVVLDTTHGFIDIHFCYSAMVVNSAKRDKIEQARAVFNEDNRINPLMTTKRSQRSLVIHRKRTLTLPVKFNETASMLSSPQSSSTIIDKKVTVRVTDAIEKPYIVK